MRPLLKFALTAVICAGVIFAYRCYQAQNCQKKQRKLKRKPKRSPTKSSRRENKVSPPSDSIKCAVREVSSEEEHASKNSKKVRLVGSDILHPEPFDNVNMVVREATVPSIKDNKTIKQKNNKSNKSVKLTGSMTDSEIKEITNVPLTLNSYKYQQSKDGITGSPTVKPKDPSEKLTGSMMESEIREIESSPITFKQCEYVKASMNNHSKSAEVLTTNSPGKETKQSTETSDKEEDVTTAKSDRALSAENTKADQKENASPDLMNSKEETGIENKKLKEKEHSDALEKVLKENESVRSSAKPPVIDNISSTTTSSNPNATSGSSGQTTTMSSNPKSGFGSIGSSMEPLGPVDLTGISTISSPSGPTTDSSSERGPSLFKLCRCRKNNRNDMLEDEKVPKFHKNVKLIVPPTIVIPVTYQRYQAMNLLEPSGDLTELPRSLFEKPVEKEDTYLTPLNPIVHASYAAHYHACLINNLIDNYDFFE